MMYTNGMSWHLTPSFLTLQGMVELKEDQPQRAVNVTTSAGMANDGGF